MSTVEATAVYRPAHPGELTVTRQGGEAEQVPWQHSRPVPSVRALTTTDWAAVPGARWEEQPGGYWSIRVFRHEVTPGPGS